ncbi:MAG TPA: NAD(P)H-hydrate dehydratase [Methylotenera sp.]|nr:NAD(P)H-hydrate dehydratase [Methylotenera sp.]HPV44691.1 NAD(P)H-hydrate dehydratase [Methylotenera sp.]
MFQPALPLRNQDAHKGSFGSVAIIGGETGMVGAAFLAARAAVHCGAGRVYAAMLCKDAPSVDMCQPEIMLRSPAALSQLTQLDCVVIGPGLGLSNAAIDLLEFWLSKDIPLLLDADALNLIASHLHLAAIVVSRDAETVITPHPGEAARLLDTGSEYIQQNRIESALKLAKTLRVTCVLKGAGSVCAHHGGDWFINTSGNVALASGGTGDVLSGIIGSLMAQGLSGLQAAKLGVYVHGAAADALVGKGVGPIGLTASEVALEVRNIINQLNQDK